MTNDRSIAIVQYAGDYAEAFRNLETGGTETYYAQRYSIEAVAALLRFAPKVLMICCTGPAEVDTLLPNGVRSVTLASGGAGRVDEARVTALLRASGVTHLCLRTPLSGVLRHALADRSVRSVLATLADSFNGSGLRAGLWHWRLARWLNHRKVAAVGNHGLPSCRSLARIGVDPARIVPWDWPHAVSPRDRTTKSAPPPGRPWRLLFIGLLSDSKGLGDCIEAIRLLRAQGIDATLDYAGSGDHAGYAARVSALGLDASIHYLGKIPHATVIPRMREADLVVVPSRHDYPEGFPMTIYEALCSRTPVVASDHPMYAKHLSDHAAARIFPAGDAAALAEAVAALTRDPAGYAALSAASLPAWEALQLPVTWGDLLHDWAGRSPERPPAALRHALEPST